MRTVYVNVNDAARIEEAMNARLADLPRKLAPELARLLAARGPDGAWTESLDSQWQAAVEREADAILRIARAELLSACETGSGTA